MTSRAKREGVDMISTCVGSEGGAGGWESEESGEGGEVVRRDLPQ